MQLFYNPSLTSHDKEITFDKDESRHIHKVLRLPTGSPVKITNGQGYFFDAEITHSAPKSVVASIHSFEKTEPLPYRLHLAVAPTKLNNRYEWFLEKATEIGVTEITPVICEHSERKIIKPERYEKIILSALKQSLKAYMPVLNKTVSFSDFIRSQKDKTALQLIAHCEETDKKSLKSVLKPKQDILILIGPEGDFSKEEIDFAVTNGFVPVSLGSSRLRTETAAIVACHSVAFIHE